MSGKRNIYLDEGVSDESDGSDGGYDSEAAEISRTGRSAVHTRPAKRRKLSDTNDNSDESDGSSEEDVDDVKPGRAEKSIKVASTQGDGVQKRRNKTREITSSPDNADGREVSTSRESKVDAGRISVLDPQKSTRSERKPKHKKSTPGVIYLSSLPPFLKPSALRNILTQRGFEPITRLFLAPASKSRRASRKMYTEGWVEFASKKTAKRCVEGLNAMPIGGRKGGYYHDDIWNMKYLKGMEWSELMAGIREEKREEEGRRDEERRTIARETKAFVEGVEQGKILQGIKKKRSQREKDGVGTDGQEVQRTWRQHEVKGQKQGLVSDSGLKGGRSGKQDGLSDDVRQVLGKIF